ncbi:DUF3187 family protein [Labilibacter sediminis]|nr:DUF3187 family protein [Labilibacter sediminis]
MKLKYILLIVIFIFSHYVSAQEDLMSILDNEVEEEAMEVAYTFKSTRVINAHSIERMKAKQLDFRINHRFGELNSGAYDFWGLDNALVSIDFGYGINDWLMVGLRRSTYEKTYDGSLKFSILRQQTGKRNIPVAVSYYTNLAVNTLKDDLIDSNRDSIPFSLRLSYTHQLLVAHKLNEAISLQLMPTFVHRNLVDYDEENDIIAVGFGGRYKFHRRVALMVEYFWASHTADNDKYFNPLSVGVDIETGGHVFQLFVSNSRIMEESGFISKTTGSWNDGGVYFGFNISRVFAIGKAKH